jgi:hypothetical protein
MFSFSLATLSLNSNLYFLKKLFAAMSLKFGNLTSGSLKLGNFIFMLNLLPDVFAVDGAGLAFSAGVAAEAPPLPVGAAFFGLRYGFPVT